MTAFVVDASVAVKWFLPEIHAEAAGRILKSKQLLLAPDLIWAEVGNAVWKKVRWGEITSAEAEGILKDFIRFPLQTYASKTLLEAAWRLADQVGITVYDGLYLALAAGQGCPLITADRKLYQSIRKKPIGSRLIWVEDVK